MKKRVYICIPVLIFIFFNILSATVTDDILQVPMTWVAPEIDGKKDAVWFGATAEPMLQWVDGVEPDEDWIDLYAVFYIMCDYKYLFHDAEYIYFYFDVMDNSIETDSPNAWENDSIDIYFDCANLKNDTYVADNNYQLHYVYGDVETGSGCPGQTDEWAWMETDYGYAFELMIPTSELTALDFEAGNEFGFDVQVNDRDNATCQTMAKWWTNDSRVNPSLFGTAVFVDNWVNDPLSADLIYQPEIDGEMDDVWGSINTVSMTAFVDDGSLDLNDLSGPDDIRADFKVAFDENDIYLYVMVVDDEINTSSNNAWENDGIELFFDAQNKKNEGMYIPGNDVHWRWVYGDVNGHPGPGNETVAWLETDLGYAMELMIPATDLPRKYGFGSEIGFEIQVNDYDGGELQNSLQWWAGSSDVKTDPSLFGTMNLCSFDACWWWDPLKDTVHKLVSVSQHFHMCQNFPNPFNPTTKISYNLPKKSHVSIKIFDVTGREILILVNQEQPAGSYDAVWNGRDRFGQAVGSGIYFYQLKAGDYVETRKMVLVR